MKQYKELILETSPLPVDLLTGLLWELDILGIVEENTTLKIFVVPGFDQQVVIDLMQKLQAEKSIETFNLTSSTFENKNWNEEWEKTLNIIHVTPRIVIRPSTKEYTPAEGEIVLTIDPKMSFGTGEHQTTKLMITAIEKYINHGTVADIGTGTGVLAIAAVKLGAERAVAIDNDEWCYENGVENIQLNDVADKVTIMTGIVDDIKEPGFDAVLANIQKNVLLDIAESLIAKVHKGGLLVLSGILLEDEEDILKKYTSLGMSKVETFILDEWKAVVLKRQ
jgi:ribosomal protein L11 methyltransferase